MHADLHFNSTSDGPEQFYSRNQFKFHHGVLLSVTLSVTFSITFSVTQAAESNKQRV